MDTKKRKIVDFDAYRSYFSDPNLWSKLKNVAKKAGVKVVYSALVLYYVTRDPKVPTSEKLKIYGALGYFILPIDLIPDSVIALGFTDDLAALAWAIYAVTEFVTPEIEAQAEAKLHEWFGDFDKTKIAGLIPQRCSSPVDETPADNITPPEFPK